MDGIGTILVLDAKSTISAHKIFDTTEHIVVPVRTAPKAQHLLEQGVADVLVCDLSIPNLPLVQLLDTATSRSPGMQIVLTGPLLTRLRAEKLISQGYAHLFIPKPWQMAGFRRDILGSLKRSERDPNQQPTSATQQPPSLSGQDTTEGRYEIQELIGDGGTGRVYRARDLLLGMSVAIKIVHPALAEDPAALESLKAEARIAMQLSHTHIVRLFNFSRLDGRYLLVMEYIHGQTLQELVDGSNTLSAHTVMQLANVCGTALDYAHRHGVLHNDLKPANILLSEDGVLKVIDFGIACLVDRAHVPGWIVGTPEYMSPEQLRGDRLNVQTDVYAVGMILYQLLTGTLPYPDGLSADELAETQPQPLEGLPSPVLAVLEKAIHPDRSERWPNIVDFINRFLDVCHEHHDELRIQESPPA